MTGETRRVPREPLSRTPTVPGCALCSSSTSAPSRGSRVACKCCLRACALVVAFRAPINSEEWERVAKRAFYGRGRKLPRRVFLVSRTTRFRSSVALGRVVSSLRPETFVLQENDLVSIPEECDQAIPKMFAEEWFSPLECIDDAIRRLNIYECFKCFECLSTSDVLFWRNFTVFFLRLNLIKIVSLEVKKSSLVHSRVEIISVSRCIYRFSLKNQWYHNYSSERAYMQSKRIDYDFLIK